MDNESFSKDLTSFTWSCDSWFPTFSKNNDELYERYGEVIRHFDAIQKGTFKHVSEAKANFESLKQKYNSIRQNFKKLPYKSEDYEQQNEIIESYKLKIDLISQQIHQASGMLPRYSKFPMKMLLGNLDITLYRNKLGYKENYEKQKVYASLLAILLIVLNLVFFNQKLIDTIVHCYTLYYYMSLMIQESILVTNGSKIKLWWRLHHYLASISIVIMLVWPEGRQYNEFRTTQFIFGITQCCAQIFQFTYQYKQLYRLRSMGVENSMTTTSNGHDANIVWGSRCLLIPLLGIIYVFQLCIARKLFVMFGESGCYQVLIQSILFTIFGVINSTTLFQVIYQKYFLHIK